MLFSELQSKLQNDNDALWIGELNIKKYLPLLHKKVLVNQICDDVIFYDENGMAYVDYIQKQISTYLVVLLNYCDLQMDEGMPVENIISILDSLIELGWYKRIEQIIGDDVYEFYCIIDEEIESIKERSNTVEAIIARGVNTLINKLPDDKQIKSIIKVVSKELNKFDPEKLTQIKEMMKVVK